MRVTLAAIVGATCMAAACAALSVGAARAESRQAQAQQQPQPQAQPQPQQPPAAASPPVRTEIVRFEGWSVTCNEYAEANRKRHCVAQMQVQPNNANQVVMTWSIAINDNKQFVMAIQTPTGVMIAPGVKLKLEKAAERAVAYESCDTGQCIATQVIDNNLLRDLSAATTAQVTMQANNGSQVNLNFSIKGADKALAHLRSKL
jgi:invasion protein IalB